MAKIHAPEEFTVLDMTSVSTISNGKITTISDNDIKDVNLRHEFRYIFRTMAIFGLYHTPKSWRKQEKGGNFKDFLHQCHRFYCIFVQLILFLNVVKSGVGLWYMDGNTMVMVTIMCVWWLMCAVNGSIWYHICSTDKLPKIFDFWQTHCQSSPMCRMTATSISIAWIRRRKFIIFSAAWSFIISDFVFPAFARLGPIESLRNDTIFLVAPATDPIMLWNCVTLVSTHFANAAFSLPPAFLLILCSIISRQFHQLTKQFHRCITDDSKFKGCLIALRRQHQYLSKFVFALDDTFSFYLAFTIGMLIFLACFQMYQIAVANTYTSFLTIFLAAFWLSMCAIKFALMGILTATVHEQAHDIVNYIHDIGVFGFKEHEQVTQMNMFMAKLNGPAIALTLWGIVPLTKEFLLTVVGVYFTYFALVVQTF